jgi:imidazolonepropionase-like amidohydrolase
MIGSGSDMVGPGQPFTANELELQGRVMGPMNAILAATKVNAEIMKVEDKVGTVEVGKFADLLLIDGNPLDDLRIFQDRDKIQVIMQDGKFMKKTR